MHIYILLNKKPDKTPGSPGHLIRPDSCDYHPPMNTLNVPHVYKIVN